MLWVVQREQATGNRNGGCRVDYEIVYAVPAAPFSNNCHCGASIAATGFSGIPRLIFNAGTFPLSWLYRFARGFSCSLFPVDCSLFTSLCVSVYSSIYQNLYATERLGTVHKLFVQNAPNEFVSARRRRETCRGTLTDDNAAMADSGKHNV